ncbi:MAG: sugar phosphate nucleotidyltransferase [Acutalibacteraceae bacterium]|nr:sugar phosphate nucleotidyltransferase [Acutalibacteraceae bacterium]
MANKSAVILAGGEGKRMKSNKPKTLSEVLDKPMLQWVIDALKKSGVDNICVVKGYKKECIEKYLENLPYNITSVYQAERLGTGHAVMMAKNFLLKNSGDVIILNGDAPFMDSETISKAYEQHNNHNSSATVISAKVDNPTGYGRIVRTDDGSLKAIVEQKDADENTLTINEVNSGGFWFDCNDLLSVLDNIRANNSAKEYYLPDALKLLIENGKVVNAYTAESSDTVLGANDPVQLAELNEIAKAKYGKYPY